MLARRYLLNTIADQLLARGIHKDTGNLWQGFVVFCSFILNSASFGPACELLLRLPAAKLDALLRDERLVKQNARAKIADYVSRLHDRVIDSEIKRVLGL